MGEGSDIELRGGSFSRLVVIELSLELVLLIARVSGASLGRLVALSLMMMHNGWDCGLSLLVCRGRARPNWSLISVVGRTYGVQEAG